MAKATTNVKSKVKNIGALWGKARETTANDTSFGDAVPVEPGMYKMQLVSAEVGDFGGTRKLLTRWCVLDDGDFQHKLCTSFDQCDTAEKLVWVQRLMVSVGIDLESCGLDDDSSEDDMVALFQDKVDEQTVCKVKVTEKDGYTNMRVKNVDESVDESEKVDPKLAAKGKLGQAEETADEEPPKKGKGKKEEPEDEPAAALEEGDRVSWENEDGETVEGEVVALTDNDDAKVREDGQKKSVLKPLDALTKIDAEVETPAEEEPAAQELEKGSDVTHNGKAATVTSVPPKGTKVQVTYDKTKKVAMVERDELELVAPEPEETPAEEEGATIEVGSKVIATIKGKDKAGVVKSIDEENGTAKVKVGNELIKVEISDLSVEGDG